MGSNLQKVGQGNKIGTIACGIGAVSSFIFLPSLFIHFNVIVGIALICLGIKFFWGLMKDYAGSGKRF